MDSEDCASAATSISFHATVDCNRPADPTHSWGHPCHTQPPEDVATLLFSAWLPPVSCTTELALGQTGMQTPRGVIGQWTVAQPPQVTTGWHWGGFSERDLLQDWAPGTHNNYLNDLLSCLTLPTPSRVLHGITSQINYQHPSPGLRICVGRTYKPPPKSLASSPSILPWAQTHFLELNSFLELNKCHQILGYPSRHISCIYNKCIEKIHTQAKFPLVCQVFGILPTSCHTSPPLHVLIPCQFTHIPTVKRCYEWGNTRCNVWHGQLTHVW